MTRPKKEIHDDSAGTPSLRERAERRLQAVKHEQVSTLSREEIRKLVHELETHQIELEMQNEELREAQRSLETSREKYTSLFNLAPVGYMTLNPLFQIEEVNFTAANMLGRNIQELYGIPFLNLVAKSDRGLLVNHMNALVRNRHGRHHQELNIIRKDGSQLYIRLESTTGEEHGKIISRTALVDLTERRRAEEFAAYAQKQTEAQKQRLEAILETAPAGVVIIEAATGRLSYINPRAAELYGTDYNNFDLNMHIERIKVLKPDGSLYPAEELPVNLAFKGQKSHSVEMTIERPNGLRIPLIVSAAPLLDATGTITAAIVAFIDITERKRAELELKRANEELHASNRELDAFIYSVSHDLRAPLRSITGFSDLLIDRYPEKLDDKARTYLNRIVEGGWKMNHIIDDLLHLSRIARQAVDRQDVDIGKIARSIVEELRRSQPDRRVTVDIKEPLPARADPRLVEMALSNLLNNAWKFTSKTEDARIEIGTVGGEGAATYYVKDNGAGFDQELSERLFQPFRRLHSEQEFEGTGIGLAIVERIISRHGGRIWAEGKTQEGAAFYFTLG